MLSRLVYAHTEFYTFVGVRPHDSKVRIGPLDNQDPPGCVFSSLASTLNMTEMSAEQHNRNL